MVIVLMGPMGCGKTTVGQKLASRTGWKFYDADDFHPEANKLKMSKGVPLNDSDRYPWIEVLKEIIGTHLKTDQDMILACSALKKKYRRQLGINQKEVRSVYLKGSLSLLNERITSRSHDFMAGTLLQSQLDTLEEPETALIVDIAASPEQVCETIITKIMSSSSL